MLQFPTLLELVTLPGPSLDISDTLARANDLMLHAHADRAVVLRAGKPAGVLTLVELQAACRRGADPSTPLEALHLTPVPSLPGRADWQEAVHCLADPDSRGMLLVMDDAGAVQGILTGQDFCHRLGIPYTTEVFSLLDALRDAEIRLDAVFDTRHLLLGLLDREGCLLDANETALRVIGARLDEVLGLPFWETPWWRHDPNLQNQVHDAVIMARKGLASGFKASHLAVNGEMLQIDFTLRPIRDQSGQVLYLLPEGLDITERCRTKSALLASQAHYRTLLNATPVGVVEIDAGGRCVYVNHKFSDITGIARAQALEGGWLASLHPDDRGKVLQALLQSRSNARVSSVECRCILPNGRLVWLVCQIAPMKMSTGLVSGVILTLIDITEHKELETRLRLAASIFDACSEGILVVDAQNRIVSVNPAFTALLGYEADEIIGHDPGELGSARNAPSLYRSLWQAVEEQGHWQGEIWNCSKHGQDVALWMTVNTLRNRKGEVQWRFALFSDITERKRTDELIWRQANYDMLTGLPNRRLFRDRLQQEIKKATRHGQSLALFFIDLDHFKEINDTFGHDCGDQLLVEAGERIRNCLRETDTVARLGGDEFTAILPEMNDQARAIEVAMAITRTLAMPFIIEDQQACISASVGIAFYPQDAANDLVLLKAADRAMYAAKAKGRNRFSMVEDQE